MLIFLALVFLGFVVLVGGALFGHDHDHDAHFDHDHDHDVTHGEPTVSIFSLKVIGSFIMAFGAAGAIASWNGYGWIASSLIGLVAGSLLGFFMLAILRVLYSQQSNSLVSTDQTIGKNGFVTVEIGNTSVGSVDVMLAGQVRTYLARSTNGTTIPKGSGVTIVRTNGSEVIVEVKQ